MGNELCFHPPAAHTLLQLQGSTVSISSDSRKACYCAGWLSPLTVKHHFHDLGFVFVLSFDFALAAGCLTFSMQSACEVCSACLSELSQAFTTARGALLISPETWSKHLRACENLRRGGRAKWAEGRWIQLWGDAALPTMERTSGGVWGLAPKSMWYSNNIIITSGGVLQMQLKQKFNKKMSSSSSLSPPISIICLWGVPHLSPTKSCIYKLSSKFWITHLWSPAVHDIKSLRRNLIAWGIRCPWSSALRWYRVYYLFLLDFRFAFCVKRVVYFSVAPWE